MHEAVPAVDDLYRSMGRMIVRFYGSTHGADCVIASHAILGCSGLNSVFLNCGVIFGDVPGGEDSAEARLREFVARIGERRVGGYICLSERVQAELEPLARDLGLEPLPPIPLMVRPSGPDAAQSAPTAHAEIKTLLSPDGTGRSRSCRVEPVTTEVGLAEFLAVSEAAFDLPRDLYGRVITRDLLGDPALTAYLVRLDGAAVGCVCVVADDGVLGVSGMATLPELQGRGLGGRLLAHVLRVHADRTRAFYLTASEAGQPLYLRHGFRVVDAATAWVVSAAE